MEVTGSSDMRSTPKAKGTTEHPNHHLLGVVVVSSVALQTIYRETVQRITLGMARD